MASLCVGMSLVQIMMLMWAVLLHCMVAHENGSCDSEDGHFIQLRTNRHKEAKSAAYKFKWKIEVINGNVAYVEDASKKNSGCAWQGRDIYLKEKGCRCDNYDGEFYMQGVGTVGTFTGLDFTCDRVEFTFNDANTPENSKLTCSIRIVIPFVGSNALYVSCDRMDLAIQSNNNEFPDLLRGVAGWHWLMPSAWYHCTDCKFETMKIQLAPGYVKQSLPDYTKSNGFWKRIGSGGSHEMRASVTSSKTVSRADASSVTNSMTLGIGCTATDTTGAEISISMEYSRSWAETVTNTFQQTDGTSKTVVCNNIECAGAYYQWSVESNSDDAINGPTITTETCNFVCSHRDAPKCALGGCNSNYFGEGTKKSLANQCPCCLDDYPDKAARCRYNDDGSPSTAPYAR